MKLGFQMTLDNGTSVQERVGVITDINPIDGTITTGGACTNAYEPFTTKVVLYLYVALGYPISGPTTHRIGYGTMGGKPLPAGTAARITYHNVTGTIKPFMYSCEFTY